MATLYDVVNNSFLDKMTDSYLLTLSISDLEILLNKYRVSAEIRFKQCKKLIEKDDVTKQYDVTLTNEEVEILSNLMVIEWLRPQINSIELIKQKMSTKDYKLTSQQAHLEQLANLKKDTESEISKLITSYTYTENSLDDLKRKEYSYD